jgi:hypothetical protein
MKRFQVSPLRLSGYAGQAARPPAKTTAGLIDKRNFKKRISNIECRRKVFYLFIKKTERHAAQAPALRERIHPSKFCPPEADYSAFLRFAVMFHKRFQVSALWYEPIDGKIQIASTKFQINSKSQKSVTETVHKKFQQLYFLMSIAPSHYLGRDQNGSMGDQ